jgi:hypothetical protein
VQRQDITEAEVSKLLSRKKFIHRVLADNTRPKDKAAPQPFEKRIIYDVRFLDMPEKNAHLQLFARLEQAISGVFPKPRPGISLLLKGTRIRGVNYHLRRGWHCNAFANLVMQRVLKEDIDTVFIAFHTWWSIGPSLCRSVNDKCIQSISSEDAVHVFLPELGEKIQTLRERGKRVIISLPFPLFDKSIPDLQIRNAVFGRTARAKELTLPSVRDDIAAIARKTGAEIFDPRASLCRPDCITEVNGVAIYRDQQHLVASQVGILRGNLKQALDQSLTARRDQVPGASQQRSTDILLRHSH